MKTVFTISTSFLTEVGHDRAYHTSLQNAFQNLGYRVFTFIPLACRATNLPPNWISFFRRSRLLDYLRLLKRDVDILFLESYGLSELFALFIALLIRRRHLALWQVIRDSRRSRTHALMSHLLRWTLRGNYHLFSDSALVIRAFKQPMTLLPIPHTPLPGTTRSSDKVSLWLPGAPRAEKGLQQLHTFCRSKDPTLRQMKLFLSPTPLFDTPLDIEIQWVPTALSRKDYCQLFHEVDILLFPYDPLLYATRTSGPFVEAITLNKCVFTRNGSWLAHELRQHDLSECILDWDAPLAPTQMLAVFYDETVREKRAKMYRAYKEFHNEETFQKSLKSCLV